MWKINAATPIKTTSPSAAVAGVGDPGFRRKASAAQIASTRWKKGSQRKLQRNKPAVGVMQSRSTTKSNTSSHLMCLTTSRGRQINAATSADGATKPQANSAVACERPREEKSVQLTVHDGRINPGNAAGGTRCGFATNQMAVSLARALRLSGRHGGISVHGSNAASPHCVVSNQITVSNSQHFLGSADARRRRARFRSFRTRVAGAA